MLLLWFHINPAQHLPLQLTAVYNFIFQNVDFWILYMYIKYCWLIDKIKSAFLSTNKQSVYLLIYTHSLRSTFDGFNGSVI